MMMVMMMIMMMMSMEQSVERDLANETEVLGENLPHCHFVLNKFHLGCKTIRRGGKYMV
jgi:hypothetical protein